MSLEIDWSDISYLRRGTGRQQQAYEALRDLGVLRHLSRYTPRLVGTIPLDIDVDGSDLDIICEAHDLDAFARLVTTRYGGRPGFRLRHKVINDSPTVVANFNFAGFPVEIFGQPRPVTEQNAYRHMLVEARLLAIGGEAARQAIRQLKQSGLKTEPAFARYFRIEGDPYQALLALASLSEAELGAAIRPPE